MIQIIIKGAQKIISVEFTEEFRERRTGVSRGILAIF